MECSEEDIYTIAGYEFDWRVVGRRLIGDQKVRDIDRGGSSETDKRDKMLLEWNKAKSRDDTYQALVKVLRAIENNATADRVEALEKSKSQASTSHQSTTDVPLRVVKYAEYLKGVYKVKPCGEQWPLVVSKHYINLSTIESIEYFPKEKEVTSTLAMIHAKIEEVKKLERSITIDQVGVLGDGERARCVIVEGIPGIGKSTFSWHLGVCWAKKEILHDYHLVVLLRLRDERVQHAKCVSDLFRYKEQPKQEHEAVMEWINSNKGDGVMMVLDGYDELATDLQTSSIFADIIRGEVLPKMTVLVSSRPSANENLRQLCQDQKCQYIEVIGFGKEKIQEYVDAALGHNKELRDQLMSYLEHHPHIHGLMYCPLICAIIVQIFRDQMKSRGQPPQTLTEVLQVLTKTVLKRHEQKSVEPAAAMKHKRATTIPNKPSTFPWLGDVSDQTIPQLLELAKLAYDGTYEDRLIFHGPSGTMETLGLLQEVPELYLESSGSSSYHFLHTTVQEFMAALHVSSLPPSERAEFIRTSFEKRNMRMVVRFMAGLTKFQSQDDIESVLAFQKEGERGFLESLHWLFEAHDPGLVQKCMGHRQWMLQLIGKNLDPFDCYVLGYCISNSRQPWNLSLPLCYINGQCVKMLMMVEKERAFDYIKTIDFRGNVNLGDEGAIVLGKMLRRNKVLTSLKLWKCGIGPEGLSELCSALEVNTTLTVLDLSNNRFDDHSLASLGKMLRCNKVLTSLKLRDCDIGPEGFSELSSTLDLNTTLTKLDLSENVFDDHSLASLGPSSGPTTVPQLTPISGALTQPVLTPTLGSMFARGFKRLNDKAELMLYKVTTYEVFRNEKQKIETVEIGPKCLDPSVPSKVLIILGQTGDGKSTLINAMINYIFDIKWEDSFRFVLIPESKHQTHSQTQWITAYAFNVVHGSKIMFNLIIIDTPGFSNTQGLERDLKLVDQIQEFFSNPDQYGIDHLDGIALTVKAHDSRLTHTQRYIFHAVMSIFGKNVKRNIFVMATHADGGTSKVFEALQEAGIPSDKKFVFNNSALFTPLCDSNNFSKMCWEMGVNSIQLFLTEFQKVESLTLTKEVLKDRIQLEVSIQRLQHNITEGMSNISCLRQEIKLLREYKESIDESKNFTYDVVVQKQRLEELDPGVYVTNYLACNRTSHFPCTINSDEHKHECAAMMPQSDPVDAACSVCPAKCSWQKYKNNPQRYEIYSEKVTRTYEDLNQVVLEAKGAKKTLINMITTEKRQIENNVFSSIQQAHSCIQILEKIALKPNPLSQVQYIEMLIEAEQHDPQPGWEDCVCQYERAKKAAKRMSHIKGQTIEVFLKDTEEAFQMMMMMTLQLVNIRSNQKQDVIE